MNFSWLLTLACLFKVLTSQIITSGIQHLIDKFHNKIDTNVYFHYQHERQKNQPNMCSSMDGPFCKFINNQSLVQDDEFNKKEAVIQFKKVLLQETKQKIHEIEEKSRFFPDQLLFTIPQSKRIILDKMRFGLNKPDSWQELIQFEELTVQNLDQKLDIDLSLQVENDESSQMPEDFRRFSELKLSFENFFIPGRGKIQFKMKQQSQEKLNKQGDNEEDPKNIYIYTQKNGGRIKFNQPVIIKHFFVRKHDYVLSLQKEKNKKVGYKVQGMLNSKFKVEFSKESQENYNKWIKMVNRNREENYSIDELLFEENTDVDNISLFGIGQFKELEDIKEEQGDIKANDKIELDQMTPGQQTAIKTDQSKKKKKDIQYKYVYTIIDEKDLENSQINKKLTELENKLKKSNYKTSDLPQMMDEINEIISDSKLQPEIDEASKQLYDILEKSDEKDFEQMLKQMNIDPKSIKYDNRLKEEMKDILKSLNQVDKKKDQNKKKSSA